MYILGQWPNPRTLNNPRTGKHFHNGGSRKNPSSAGKSQGQKMRSDIKSNVPDDSTNKDKKEQDKGRS